MSQSQSMPFDPISPTKFDNSEVGLLARNALSPFSDLSAINVSAMDPPRKGSGRLQPHPFEESKNRSNSVKSKESFSSDLRKAENAAQTPDRKREFLVVDPVDPFDDFGHAEGSVNRASEKTPAMETRSRGASFNSVGLEPFGLDRVQSQIYNTVPDPEYARQVQQFEQQKQQPKQKPITLNIKFGNRMTKSKSAKSNGSTDKP